MYNDENAEVGDEVEILYQSSNPEKYAATNNASTGIVFIIVGALVTLGGIFGAIRAFLKR